MAENPIRKEDIIDAQGVSASIKTVIDLLQNELTAALKAATAEALKYKEATTSANAATSAGQQAISDQSKKTSELSDTKRVLIKMQKDLDAATSKYLALRSEEGRAMADQIQKTKDLTKGLSESAKAAKLVDGSYAQLAKKLKDLREQWRMASDEGRKGLTPQIQKLDGELKRLDKTVGNNQRNVGNYSSAFKGLGRQMLSVLGLTGGLTALFNVVKDGFKTSIAFEKAMSDVKAVSGATNEQFSALKENAIALGGATKFTAIEVAGLQKEYSKLGFTSDQILAMTKATLDLSAATGESLAQSAMVAGSTLRQFGLDATQMDMVVDVMAKSFSSSALDLNKFETSMQSVGPVANAVGVTLQRTTANLSVLANAGLDASVSGTSLRNIYLELERKGMTWDQALDMLNNTTNKASLSLELFGKRGAVAGLVLAENRVEADAFTEAYDNAAGSAKEMADIMLDNVAGSATILKSAWEGLILRTNESEGALKGFLDTLTTVVSAINTKGKPAIDSLFETKTIDSFSDKFKLFRDTGVGFTISLVSAIFRGKEFAQEWSDELGKVGDTMRAKEAEENASRQKQTDADKKALAERTAIFEAQIEAEEKIREAAEKASDNRIKAATAAREATSKAQTKSIADQAKANSEEINAGAQDLSNELIDIKRQEVQEINELEATKEQFTKETNQAILRDKIAAMEEEFQILSDASQVLSDIFTAQKQRELNAAGDNAQKREQIERDYFKKEKSLAIAQAIINGALAVTKVTAQTGILSPFAIPLIVATTLGQIALISSQKFAEGGYTGDGSYRDETGQKVAGIVHEKEFVLDRESTRKYRPLIEAIHEDDPAKIAAIVSNEHMHNIWGNMNKAMSHDRDPYTRMMYDLMKAQPTVYVDTDGNTVLQYVGRKQVIRKN